MLFRDLFIFGADRCDIARLLIRRQKRGHNPHRAAGIRHIDRLACRIIGVDFHRRMHTAGRRPADQQRNIHARAFHFRRDMDHFIQRRGDQAGQADDIHILSLGDLKDFRSRHHHAQINDVVIVAGQHDAHDILADVMHIAFDRGHQHLARRFAPRPAIQALFLFHIGQQHRDRLFHHAGGFHDLRQEHLARAEQIANHIHPRHQRAFDHMQRAGGAQTRLFGIGIDEFGDPVDQRMFQPFFDRPVAPRQIAFLGFARAGGFEPLGDHQHVFGRSGRPVQHHIFAGGAQVGVDTVVNRQLACIDDAHIHAGLNGMIKEHGMHRLAHGVVATEAERQVRHAARHMDMRQIGLDPAGGIDEIDAVIVMLLDPCRHGEHIGVKDDILGRETHLFGQQVIGAGADFDLAILGIGLARLVKGHDNHRRAISTAEPRLMQKRLFAFFHADRIDDGFALHALQARLDHLPFGAVDHHRHAGDIGFGRDQVQIVDHRLFAVDQALVHVHVDDLCAVFDLFAGDIDGGGIITGRDQLAELGRTGDVGTLAHIHESDVAGQGKGFQPRQAHQGPLRRDRAGFVICNGIGNGADMIRRRSTAATHDIDQTVLGEHGDLFGHESGAFIIFAEFIRQARIGIGADQRIGHARQFCQMRAHFRSPQRAVQPDGQRVRMAHGMPERGRRLA